MGTFESDFWWRSLRESAVTRRCRLARHNPNAVHTPHPRTFQRLILDSRLSSNGRTDTKTHYGAQSRRGTEIAATFYTLRSDEDP
jgi:hypothetical protein